MLKLLDTGEQDEDGGEVKGRLRPFYQSHSQAQVPLKPEDRPRQPDSVAATPDYSGSMQHTGLH
jgi:hypothetical protein